MSTDGWIGAIGRIASGRGVIGDRCPRSNTRSLVLGKTRPMRYKSNIRSIERLFDIS